MKPRVTVLLAVHDGEPYVGAAVESVLDQTFGDFEFLIVDDASTDATVAIVESFGDPRIRILRNDTNLGQVPSLNRGLREPLMLGPGIIRYLSAVVVMELRAGARTRSDRTAIP